MRLKDYIQSDSGQLITTLATGTAPLAVSSTTKVENLNVDKIDDLDSNDFMRIVSGNGGYYGMAGPGGIDNIYIRTTTAGLLPYSRGGSLSAGRGTIGTAAWPFGDVWSQRVQSQWTHVNRKGIGNDGGLTLYSGSTTYMIGLRNNLGNLPNSNSTYGIMGDFSTFFIMNDDTARGWIFRRGATNIAGINGNGTYISSVNTSDYLAGNQGKVIIDSTVDSNSYTMLFRQKSYHGVFTGGVYAGDWELHYTDDTTIADGTNAITHSIQLIDEYGITKLKRLYVANDNTSGVNEDNISGYSMYIQGDAKINGPLSVQSNKGGFREGIRIYPYGNWSDIVLLGSDSPGVTGITANSWFIGNNNGNFYITRAGSKTANPVQLSCTNNIWNITGSSVFKNLVQIQHNTASLYIQDTSTDTYSILYLGNKDNTKASGMWLNSATRTDDGGQNMMTIRNNVGDLRLDNTVFITGDLTAAHLIGNADTASKLVTPRILTIGASGKAFDGSANVSWTPYDMRLTRALYNTDQHLNTFADRGSAIGMLNLSGTDATVNPNGQEGWHHIFQATWHDCRDNNNKLNNEWCSQIAVKCGTDQWYVRSRSGGSIVNGTAWTSNWRRLVTSSIGAVGSKGQPVYINASGEAEAVDWHVGNATLGEHNANNITYNMMGYYVANGPHIDPRWDPQLTYKNGGIYSQGYSSAWVTQMAQSYVYGELFIRSKRGNDGWQPWEKVIDTRNMKELFTNLFITNGTTAGPTITATVGGTNKAVILPAATTTNSGVVTTGDQSFSGIKTFASNIHINDNSWAALYLKTYDTIENSGSAVWFGNRDNDLAAQIWLNGASRADDGGPNTMTIRNNVGDIRIANNITVTGTITAIGGLIGNANSASNASNADRLDNLDSTAFLRAVNANGFYGMAIPGGDATAWIRTTTSGIIPYQSGSIVAGHGGIGTSSWPFADVWSQRVQSQWTHVNRGATGNDGGITFYSADSQYMIALRNNLGTLANSNNTYGINEGFAMFFTMNNSTNRGWIFRRGATNVAGITGEGTYLSSVNTGSHLAGNQGKVIIDSTVGPNTYTMLFRQKSSNGVFTGGVYKGDWELHYTDNTTIANGANAIIHSIQLLDEQGITKLKRLYIANANITGQNTDNISGYNLYSTGNARITGELYVDKWVRTTGKTGWYNETYGGGWWMQDTTWIYAYNNKAVYTGGIIRSDNTLQVGSGGTYFYANNAGNGYFSNTLGIGGKNTSYKLYVNGTSYLRNNVCIGGTNASYRLYVSGTSYLTGNVCIGGTNASYRLYVSGTSYLTGNVCIGGTSSSYRLYVNGTAYFTGNTVANSCLGVGGSNTSYKLYVNGTAKIIGNLTAPRLIGNADTATKLTTSAGNASIPVFFSDGKPVAIDWHIGNNGTGEHNANNITYNMIGYYTSNGPATSLGATTNNGAIYAQGRNSSWVGQIAQDYSNGGLYVRGKKNGTWQPWYRVLDTRKMGAGSGLNADMLDGTHANGLLTNVYWGGGTTGGPIVHVVVGGTDRSSTIPSAGTGNSGVVTTGTQSFAGQKTFTGNVRVNSCLGVGGLNTSYKLYVSGTSYLTGNVCIGGTSSSYKLYVYGTAYATKIYGAVWNDYAEYRQARNQAHITPGRVVVENGDDTISISHERLAPGGMIVSDTFGFAIGQIEKVCETPVAVSGRVLAYPYENRNSYQPGDAVCTGPNGTVSKMTRKEIREYPERIIGIVSAIPNYPTWGTNNVPVNGRIWIRVR